MALQQHPHLTRFTSSIRSTNRQEAPRKALRFSTELGHNPNKADDIAEVIADTGTGARKAVDPPSKPAADASKKPPARNVDITPNGGARPGLPMNIDDAIDEVRRGGDVLAESRDAARQIAEQAGDGPPFWDPPHGPGQKPHWDPTIGCERAPGHVLY